MLTPRGLYELARAMGGERVLSVYIDGTVHDPARKIEWRQALDAEIERVRATLRGSDRDVRRQFEACVLRLRAALPANAGALGSLGWAAFIVPDGVRYAAAQRTPMPMLVDWRLGGRIAPYLRALQEDQPVYVVMVDSQEATILHYRYGVLKRLKTFHVRSSENDVLHMGNAPRQHFHPGTIGVTGTDAAEHAHRSHSLRMYRQLRDELVSRAVDGGWLVIGGTPQPAKEVLAELPDVLRFRAHLAPDLGNLSTLAEVVAVARRLGSELRREEDATEVEMMLERAGNRKRGLGGLVATRHAALEGTIHELLLTPTAIELSPNDVERIVRAALEHGAEVEVVTGEGADRLDAEAEGVGAILRYVAAKVPAAAET